MAAKVEAGDRQALSIQGVVEFARNAVSKYPKKELEMEARFIVSVADAIAILQDLEKKAKPEIIREIELSKEIQGEGRETVRQQFHRDKKGTIKGSDKQFMRKTELARSMNEYEGAQHRVHVSWEKPLDRPSHVKETKIRFKLRFSFQLKGMEGWQLDLTFMAMPDAALMTRQSDEKFLSTLEEMFFGELDAAHLQKNFTGANLELERTAPLELLQPEELKTRMREVVALIVPFAASNQINERVQMDTAQYFMDGDRLERFRQRPSFKTLLPQVRALTRTTYREMFPPTGYLVTDKADGEIAAIVIRGDRVDIVMARTFMEVSQVRARMSRRETSAVMGEVLWKDPDAPPSVENIRLILLFDVSWFNDRSLLQRVDFDKRIELLPDRAEELRSAFKLPAFAKKFFPLGDNNLEKSFMSAMKATAGDQTYEKDGLILYHPRGGFWETRVWKWKPLDKITLDFLAHVAPKSLRALPPYSSGPDGATLLLLYVGVTAGRLDRLNMLRHPKMDEVFPHTLLFPEGDREYVPIQFSPPDQPYAYLWFVTEKELGFDPKTLSGKIVELGMDTTKESDSEFPSWVFHRVREDREGDVRAGRFFGNDLTMTAIPSWLSLRNPLPLKQLWAPEGDPYFEETSDTYFTLRRYNRFVSGQLIHKYFRGAPIVLDLGGGRGADLPRFASAKVGNVLFIEPDRDALTELVLRRVGAVDKWEKLGVYTMPADLRVMDREQEMIRDIRAHLRDIPGVGEQVGGVFANFSFHYFGVGPNQKPIATVLKEMVAPGGVFVFTVFDGERIDRLLKGLQVGESWSVREPGAALPKYQIEKRYQKPGPLAQIAVLHPFSNGELYPEPLVLLDEAFFKVFDRAGFTLEARIPFDNYLDQFKSSPEGERFHVLKQSEADMQYMKLYEAVVMRRKNKGGKIGRDGAR